MSRRSGSITALCAVAAMLAASPALAYEAGTVTGGGSIEGQVTYKGPVETRKVIPNKDVEVCGGIREEALIDLGPNQGVQDAAVYLVDVAKGKAWPPPAKPPELDNVKCEFVPHVEIIPTGTLDVVNKDPVLHNSHGYYGKRTAFNMAQPNEGQVIPADLPRAGIVRVDCDVHGWMLAWLYVVDNPYYALTGADGKFSIADVPPGTYKLVAVQSLTGPTEQTVTVSSGQATTLNIELKKQ